MVTDQTLSEDVAMVACPECGFEVKAGNTWAEIGHMQAEHLDVLDRRSREAGTLNVGAGFAPRSVGEASDIEIAISALEDISDPKRSSLRRRDHNCVRYMASDALGLLKRRGHQVGGVEWERYERASGDVGGEEHPRDA